MKTVNVTVVPYDAAWRTAYEAILQELEAAVGNLILGAEHVGSTSVEGLSAKPCIDIDLIIRDGAMLEPVVRGLASIGYVHEGDLGIRGREAFRYDGKTHLMRHHLYVCPQDSEELRRHVVFRDYLRSHSDAARRYGEVKEEAARLFPNDIDGYIRHKAFCIEELYAACGLRQSREEHDAVQGES